MGIVELIKKLRTQGWSYAALAHQLGVQWLAVRRWEYGERKPARAESLARELAALLGVEPPPRRCGRPKIAQVLVGGLETNGRADPAGQVLCLEVGDEIPSTGAGLNAQQAP